MTLMDTYSRAVANPDAVHGFTMSDTDAFSPSALQRHWDRLLPLLEGTLAGG